MKDGAVIPSMHFVLDDGSQRIDAGPDFSPELDLVRGEPVAVTIVNRTTARSRKARRPSFGEAFDFEYMPDRPGAFRLQVSATGAKGPGRPLISVPIRVE